MERLGEIIWQPEPMPALLRTMAAKSITVLACCSNVSARLYGNTSLCQQSYPRTMAAKPHQYMHQTGWHPDNRRLVQSLSACRLLPRTVSTLAGGRPFTNKLCAVVRRAAAMARQQAHGQSGLISLGQSFSFTRHGTTGNV
jgi:hypothetical protein